MKKRRLISLPLRLAGWQFEGEKPPEKKYVALAWPHTSNWDGLLLIALTQSIGLSMSWMIKSDWVKGPMGVVLRPLGAVGIDRTGAHNVVQDMIDAFQREERDVVRRRGNRVFITSPAEPACRWSPAISTIAGSEQASARPSTSPAT
jgi:1-acyl-sn-glycerol-3-phosphate acyltransferase